MRPRHNKSRISFHKYMCIHTYIHVCMYKCICIDIYFLHVYTYIEISACAFGRKSRCGCGTHHGRLGVSKAQTSALVELQNQDVGSLSLSLCDLLSPCNQWLHVEI